MYVDIVISNAFNLNKLFFLITEHIQKGVITERRTYGFDNRRILVRVTSQW